jgi:2-polyprenyl-3-methyl-5-hydroxy-6-metoxy-1,4-benzoquinol methylase
MKSHHNAGRRKKLRIELSDFKSDFEVANTRFKDSDFLSAFDIYEQLVEAYPEKAIPLLAEVYESYQRLPSKDRYNRYQARYFNFDIKPSDKVLDIGSGHFPFPLATHLADLTFSDNKLGRAGRPFKYVDDKPVYEINIEEMPFDDKEFDFIYCSHVLEHVGNPEKACSELIRVGKRGFIETPTRAKDLFFNAVKSSNHKWHIEFRESKIIFTEYTEREKVGLNCDILLKMNMAPETQREKAIYAIAHLKADLLNVMFLWDGDFKYEVHRTKKNRSESCEDNFANITSVCELTNIDDSNATVSAAHRVNNRPIYDEKYFQWQKNIGEFGGFGNLFKFKAFIKPSDVVLDFGCGGGYLLENIECARKIGLEVNASAREEAARRGVEVVGRITDIADEIADVIISNHALEHVQSPFAALCALYKKLKIGGKIIFVVPHQDTRGEYDSQDINRHLYTWNQQTLGNLFTAAGYRIVNVESIQHQWPENYQEVFETFGEEGFHKRCRENAVKNHNYQIRIIAAR